MGYRNNNHPSVRQVRHTQFHIVRKNIDKFI